VLTLLMPSVAVAGLLYYLRGYSREMAIETKEGRDDLIS
jgi:hypothetical protein